jgi:hypothetical protein
MPKISNTRRQRALELLRHMRNGPSLGFATEKLTRAEIAEGYQQWVASWILGEIVQLVPELRKLHKRGIISYTGNVIAREKEKT